MHDGDGYIRPRFCFIFSRFSRSGVDSAVQECQLDLGRRVHTVRWRYGLSKLGNDA